MTNTKLIDKNTTCECGHSAGHHRIDLPKPCRLCDCEAFITVKDRERLLAEEDERAHREQVPRDVMLAAKGGQ